MLFVLTVRLRQHHPHPALPLDGEGWVGVMPQSSRLAVLGVA